MDASAPLLPFHLFDREAEVRIVERRLPHWSQAGGRLLHHLADAGFDAEGSA
jgi:hypothetical protein